MKKAIIEIGTNAIRGVVYESDSLGALEVANTQFSHTFNNTIKYNNELYAILSHYKTLYKNLNVQNVEIIGTAAMRALNTESLIHEIQNKFNFKVRILSGDEEAKYVNIAINMSVKNANGVIADLGGGSLEISCIQNNKTFNVISIDIQNNKNITNEIKQLFDFTVSQKLENLYLVGGSFRLLLKKYAYTVNYPQELISHYLSIPTQQLLNYIKINTKNYTNITHTILTTILENLKIKNIIISNYGLKEGIHLSSFPNKNYLQLLLEKTQNITNITVNNDDIKPYINIFNKIIPTHITKYLYIFKITIMFAKTNKCVSHIYKSSILSNWILKINLPLSVEDRIMLYIITQNIFSYTHNKNEDSKLTSLLPIKQLYLSKIFGIILNITYNIHGCLPTQLNYDIHTKNKNIFIKFNNILHNESFNRTIIAVKKLNELIKKLNEKNRYLA